METLLQQPPAPTVRFVANNKLHDDQHVKQFDDATSRPIESVSRQHEASSSRPVHYESKPANYESSSSKPVNHEPSSSKPVNHEFSSSKSVVNDDPKSHAFDSQLTASKQIEKPKKSHKFNAAEISAAEKRRQHELGQLQTRFCDSISTR